MYPNQPLITIRESLCSNNILKTSGLLHSPFISALPDPFSRSRLFTIPSSSLSSFRLSYVPYCNHISRTRVLAHAHTRLSKLKSATNPVKSLHPSYPSISLSLSTTAIPIYCNIHTLYIPQPFIYRSHTRITIFLYSIYEETLARRSRLYETRSGDLVRKILYRRSSTIDWTNSNRSVTSLMPCPHWYWWSLAPPPPHTLLWDGYHRRPRPLRREGGLFFFFWKVGVKHDFYL